MVIAYRSCKTHTYRHSSVSTIIVFLSDASLVWVFPRLPIEFLQQKQAEGPEGPEEAT